MGLRYTIIRQAEPGIKGGGSYKYYVRACGRQRKTLEDLTYILQKRTSLCRSDIVSVMIGLSDLIPELLMDNCTVELGELGTFSLHMQSEGVSNPEEATYRKVKELKIQFRPGKRLKKAIGKVHFVRSEKSKH
jgi:predicted histone-like DNA-binding protein